MKKYFELRIVLILSISYGISILNAQQFDPQYYNIGSPVLNNIWVDPVNGNDTNSGSTRSLALKTISAAWNHLPGITTSTGYKIELVAGNYTYRDQETNNIVGLYLDEKHGSYNYPIIIESVDGPLKAVILSSFDFRDVAYVYLIGLDFQVDASSDGGGNTVHFASADHILLRRCKISGFDGVTRKAQETLKVNQTSHIFVEDCEIFGAFWFALDYVGVQYGHIQNCKIHDASEDCLLLKGGSSQIRIEGCTIYNADRFGISAGQGAGFDFLVNPWLHYEAYDLKFINNIIHNTQYAGAAVLGGYNVLVAYNTFYRVGIDKEGDRTLMTFNLGQRGCDGAEPETCSVHHNAGGWSPGLWSSPPIPNGTEIDCIPNRNVYVYNNVFYNPLNDSTIGNHIEVRAPYDASDLSSIFLQTCNLPDPVLSDDNLRIRGNLIWNGSAAKEIGINEETGCQDMNQNCNKTQLQKDNIINSFEPALIQPDGGNFHPVKNGNLFNAKTFSIPDFSGDDIPKRPQPPAGNLVNTINRDYDNLPRTSYNPPGAFSGSIAVNEVKDMDQTNDKLQFLYLNQNYPNPFNPSTIISFRLMVKSYLTLKVFDILGREVAVLMDGEKEAGEHKIKFKSSKLTAGIYFYYLQTRGLSVVKKMLLVK
jgi:hypothetical protein